MKRIQRGPVRGISLKLQEEERERRLDFIPAVSALAKEQVDVDADTNAMLKAMDVKIEGLRVVGNRKVGVGELVYRSSAPTRSLSSTKLFR